MKLLLLSNSTMSGEQYLGWANKHIKEFLGCSCKSIVFIPFAAVTFSYNEYERKVNRSFKSINCRVTSIHHSSNMIQTIRKADAIIVGGGNTWQLTRQLHINKLMIEIAKKVKNGTPYIGWSAGSNIVAPTLMTTNDMPIVNPISFNTLNLLPFQINPHYLNKNPVGFGGETRKERIIKFITLNPNTYVLCLPEGTLLKVIDDEIKLVGKSAFIFKHNKYIEHLVKTNSNLNFLLKK